MTEKVNILYVEDDKTLAFVTKDNLERLGYNVYHYENGQIALSNFNNAKFDICILDIMLPKLDGFELATKIRKINASIPILFLSAKSQTDDRITGLKLGADDYLTKPFSIEELQLKIEVFLKRSQIIPQEKQNQIIQVGLYKLDIQNQKLICNDSQESLTERETQLIAQFFNNPNNLLKRDSLLLNIWGDDSYFNGRSLDVFISRIRKYLKNDTNIEIENVRSMGFRLNLK